MGHKVLFFYASQTGNARGIAKEFCDKACAKGHDARVLGMENWKNIEFDEEPNVVVVASCTGNGDCPDNGDKFYRLVKRKTTGQILANTNFTVCSLGDSNYDAFCAVGKEFDKHFERLGGNRILKRVDVDEVEGIETFVDPWEEKLWKVLDELPKGKENDAPGSKPAAAAPPKPLAEAPAGTPNVPATPTTPAADAGVANPWHRTVAADDDDPRGSSATNPLYAPVTVARWLTSGDGSSSAVNASEGERRVLHLEIDVSAGGDVMDFLPGDAVGVLPRNEPRDIDEIMSLLKVPSASTPLPPTADGSPPPAHLSGCATVRNALDTRVDLGSVSVWPPVPLLRLLLASSSLPEPTGGGDDAASLPGRARAAIGSGPTARAAHTSLQKERPTLAALLRGLSSTPDLAKLLDALPPLAPRFYSIASAPAAAKGMVHLCLSIVHYYTVAPDGTRIARRGLASNMLASMTAPLIEFCAAPPATVGMDAKKRVAHATAPDVRIAIYKREPSGHELRLPTNPKTPVLMVGPGTGLAPFRGFIQHRRYTTDRKKLGPCHLFFGCRSEHDDFLYGEELTAWNTVKAITLHTAFSRGADPVGAGYWRGARVGIPYVQDCIEANAEEVRAARAFWPSPRPLVARALTRARAPCSP